MKSMYLEQLVWKIYKISPMNLQSRRTFFFFQYFFNLELDTEQNKANIFNSKDFQVSANILFELWEKYWE